MLGKKRRIAVMAEGSFTPMDAKTALGVIRYRPGEVVAVIDSVRAGRTCHDCVGAGGDIPVVAGLEAAAAHDPDTLLLGIAPQGGSLPESWRHVLTDGIQYPWLTVLRLTAPEGNHALASPLVPLAIAVLASLVIVAIWKLGKEV